MESVINRCNQVNRAIYFFLVFVLLMAACKGSISSNSSQDSLAQATIQDSAEVVKPIPTYTDPLFQIEGQLCQHVRNIFQDSRGHLWFGTNVYGLMRFNGDTLEYFDEKEGLSGGRITGIVEDKAGNVWFGTYSGLSKYSPAENPPDSTLFRHFNEEDGLVYNEIWNLAIDEQGIIWIATTEGLSQFNPHDNTFTTFPIPQAQVENPNPMLSDKRITCILKDSKGKFWFGTDGYGICIYDPMEVQNPAKAFRHLRMKEGLPDHNIGDLMEDSKGNIWIGTMFGGMSRYDPRTNTFSHFMNDSILSGEEAYALFEDKQGYIWFAVEGYGVYRYDSKNDSFTNFFKKEGLASHAILSILEDREGRFWFGGWMGLFRYDPTIEAGDGKSFVPVTLDGPWL